MKKKSRFKAMYFCLCMMMCLPQIQYAKTTKTKSTPGTAIFVMASTEQNIEVYDEVFTIQRPELKLEMHVPQFKNLTNTTFQNTLNNQLLKEAKQRKKQIAELAKESNKDMLKDGLQPIVFEYIETFSVIPSLYPNYTVELYQYQYSGGAHGLTTLSYINLNQEKEQLVMLSDLFNPQSDYIGIINQLVRREIERRQAQGEFFFSGSDGFQTIKSNQPFFINKNGDLVIVFNVYEIAPYASGPVYITLPISDLLSYMK